MASPPARDGSPEREAAGPLAARPASDALDRFALLQIKPTSRYEGYDSAEEEKTYCRSLLSAADLKAAKSHVEEHGGLTSSKVASLLENNTSQRFTPAGVSVLDADLVAQIDQLTEECMFVLPNNAVHSRAELLSRYPFEVLGIAPEEVFARQELGVFPASSRSFDQTKKRYQCRDVGSGGEFVLLEDRVARAARKRHVDRHPPERVVQTKIYLAREGWDDFLAVVRQVRLLRRFTSRAARAGILGLAAANSARPAALEDKEGWDARRAREAAELAAREAAVAAREAEMAAREAELLAHLEGLA